MTRWSTIIVAVIGAVGVLGAAAIGLLKSDGGSVQLSTSTIEIVHVGAGEIIDVVGKLTGNMPANAQIYGFARPEDHGHVADDPAASWYVGGPAVLTADGGWRVNITIAPDEKRDLSVSAALMTEAPAPPARPASGHEENPSAQDTQNKRKLEENGPQDALGRSSEQNVILQD